MKVLVHLNHGCDKSVLMHFGQSLNEQTVKKLLKKDGIDSTVSVLQTYARISNAVRQVEIEPAGIMKAEREADLTIDQHGTGSVRFA